MSGSFNKNNIDFLAKNLRQTSDWRMIRDHKLVTDAKKKCLSIETANFRRKENEELRERAALDFVNHSEIRQEL